MSEDRKTKNLATDISKGILYIECERNWQIGLDATSGDGQKIKNYFCNLTDFPGKTDSAILLGFECTINRQNLIKIVGAIFKKSFF